MAKPALQIRFVSPAPVTFMHRVLNFTDDVYRIARQQGIGSLDDIDRYGDGIFVVRVSSTRHLGEVLSVINKLLKQHRLERDAEVVRLDRKRQLATRDA